MAPGRVDGMLPFDTYAYGQTLSHLGPAEMIDGLPWPVFVRPIPGSDRCDALGPWPYGSPPDASQLAVALPALRARGLITLSAVLQPDCPAEVEALRRSGLECVSL